MLVFLLAFFLDFFELAFIIVPLLAPVADKLGIDLIWFGVLLGVNMQTSFMHPPFGFALFYLRSVAPARDYLDKVTGATIAPVTTGQIYWGAVPFVRDPGHHGRPDHRLPADGDALQERRPVDPRRASSSLPRRPPRGGGQQLPAPPGTDLSQPPSFGTPPADGGAQQQPAPPGKRLVAAAEFRHSAGRWRRAAANAAARQPIVNSRRVSARRRPMAAVRACCSPRRLRSEYRSDRRKGRGRLGSPLLPRDWGSLSAASIRFCCDETPGRTATAFRPRGRWVCGDRQDFGPHFAAAAYGESSPFRTSSGLSPND